MVNFYIKKMILRKYSMSFCLIKNYPPEVIKNRCEAELNITLPRANNFDIEIFLLPYATNTKKDLRR